MPPKAKPEEFPPVMTTAQVAKYLQFSEVTVRRLVRTAGLPCVEAARYLRFPKVEVDRWLSKKAA